MILENNPSDYLSTLYDRWAGDNKQKNSLSRLYKVTNPSVSLDCFRRMFSGSRKVQYGAFTSALKILLGKSQDSVEEFKEAVEKFFPSMARDAGLLAEGEGQKEAEMIEGAVEKEVWQYLCAGALKSRERVSFTFGQKGTRLLDKCLEKEVFFERKGKILRGDEIVCYGNKLTGELSAHNVREVSNSECGTGKNRMALKNLCLDRKYKAELHDKISELLNWAEEHGSRDIGPNEEMISLQIQLRTHEPDD